MGARRRCCLADRILTGNFGGSSSIRILAFPRTQEIALVPFANACKGVVEGTTNYSGLLYVFISSRFTMFPKFRDRGGLGAGHAPGSAHGNGAHGLTRSAGLWLFDRNGRRLRSSSARR